MGNTRDNEIEPLFEIGFPTRNRWRQVEETLRRLAAFGLGDTRILIFDDGSDEECPFDPRAICPGAEIFRFAESRGMIVRRNQIAREMRSRFYLGIDDDSYPVSGSIDAAVEFAASTADFFCLSFPVHNPRLHVDQVRTQHPHPYLVQGFVGCAHMMDVRVFRELGGFHEPFGYFLEEPEVAARAYLEGFNCYHFPDLHFHHVETLAARNWARQDYFGARNSFLWNDWYLSGKTKAWKQLRGLTSRLLQTARTRRLGQLQGYVAGLKAASREKTRRRPMSPAQIHDWQRRPPT